MGFQSLPYVVALFAAMLWLLFSFLKTNAFLLVSINSFGCIIEAIYIFFYLLYASKKARVRKYGDLQVQIFGIWFENWNKLFSNVLWFADSHSKAIGFFEYRAIFSDISTCPLCFQSTSRWYCGMDLCCGFCLRFRSTPKHCGDLTNYNLPLDRHMFDYVL